MKKTDELAVFLKKRGSERNKGVVVVVDNCGKSKKMLRNKNYLRPF